MSTSATKDTLAAGRLDAAYLQSLFHGAGFAILACEPDGRVVAGSVEAAKLFAGTDATQHHVSELFPERDRQTVRQLVDTCRETLEPIEFQTRLNGGETDPREYAVWVTPVLEPDGSLRGVSLWLRDITKRLRLQQAVEKNERLASLGRLAGAVSHHYSNLLCSIATSVDYAMNMNTMSAMRRALQRTADAVGRAADITRQLLAFAQADHRERDLADLTETVLYYFDKCESQLAEHRIHLRLDWQKIPAVPVPREQFLLVLNKLIDNAVDVMPEGGALSVRLAPYEDHCVCLSVTDTGAGLSADDMEHLFEPFHTSKGVLTSGQSTNTGLGLAVAHGLIHEMHGTITAANVPGSGARFDIVLPIPKRS